MGRQRVRDEASRARLAELGIESWALRVRRRHGGRGPVPSGAYVRGTVDEAPAAPAPAPGAAVTVLAQAGTPAERALLADVLRALRIAGLDAALAEGEVDGWAEAGALLMFGQAAARRAGAVVSAARQRQVGWVVAPDLAELVGQAAARRALWSELRRLAGQRRRV
jgi:DNA polymerase III psi subunit